MDKRAKTQTFRTKLSHLQKMKRRVSHINLGDIPKKRDDEGRLICLNCGKLLKGRQQKYCGWKCSGDWLCKHSHQFKRRRMIRDIGKCANCGTTENKWSFILDHITPIAIGGEEFEDDNLQLLCKECNAIKTKQDFKDIALARRKEKLEAKGQMTVENFFPKENIIHAKTQ